LAFSFFFIFNRVYKVLKAGNVLGVKVIDESKFNKQEWNVACDFRGSSKYLLEYISCDKVTNDRENFTCYVIFMEYCNGGVCFFFGN
jgi:hypothetical protein